MAKKQPQEAAATAKFGLTRKSPQIVTDTAKIAEFIKANPLYPNTPLVQSAVAEWEKAAADVAKNDQETKASHVSLLGLIAARHTAIAAWKRSTKSLLAVIDSVSGGSAQTIKGWGFDVATHVVAPTDNSPPTGIRVTFNKQMEPTIRWKAVLRQRGYNLQIGDGTATGWGPVIQLAAARYKPVGLAPGTKIHVRVAVVRKDGVSAYSDPTVVTIR